MRKLLLLLPLNLATPVLAESDPFGLNEHAFQTYKRHFENFDKFANADDWEMACSELRMASTVLKTQFSQLQKARPSIDWFKSRQSDQEFLSELCTPYGL